MSTYTSPVTGEFLFSSNELVNRESLVESGEADGVFVEWESGVDVLHEAKKEGKKNEFSELFDYHTELNMNAPVTEQPDIATKTKVLTSNSTNTQISFFTVFW